MATDITKISKDLFNSDQNTNLSVLSKSLNFVIKMVATPLNRSATLALAATFFVLLGHLFSPPGLWKALFGVFFLLLIFIIVLFVLIVPLLKPKLAQSDTYAMFVVYMAVVKDTLMQETILNGKSLEETNQLPLTQPIEKKMSESIGVSDTIDIKLIKGNK